MSAFDMAREYGFAAQLIEQDPELHALFLEAAASGVYDVETGEQITPPMSADEFRERLKQTDAYRARFPSMPGWVLVPPVQRSRWHRLRTALAQRIAPWLLDED